MSHKHLSPDSFVSMRSCVGGEIEAKWIRVSTDNHHRSAVHRNFRRTCVPGSAFAMLQRNRSLSEMFHLNNLESVQRRRCWIAVVLLAVCSITISVATRYSVPGHDVNSKVTTVRNHLDVDTEQVRQRLLNNAVSWMPPVAGSTILQQNESFAVLLSTGPPVPRLYFEQNLFNRPPPAISFLL